MLYRFCRIPSRQRAGKTEERDLVKHVATALAYSDTLGLAGEIALTGAELYRRTGSVDVGQMNVEMIGGLASGVHIAERILINGVGSIAWQGVLAATGQENPEGYQEGNIIRALKTYNPYATDFAAPFIGAAIDKLQAVWRKASPHSQEQASRKHCRGRRLWIFSRLFLRETPPSVRKIASNPFADITKGGAATEAHRKEGFP